MTRLSDALHRLAHRLDRRPQPPCRCRQSAFMEGIAMRRDAEMKERVLPSSPDALDASFRALLASNEDWPDAA